MLRRSHLLGLLGLVMIALGVGLYLRGSVDRLSLLYWLGGPSLCFIGAALFMGSILCPLFNRSADKSDVPPTPKPRGQVG